MPTLHVCSLARLPETVTATGAGHVLSLLTSGNPPELPDTVPPDCRAVIAVSDIAAATDGHVLADDTHVERIIAFVDALFICIGFRLIEESIGFSWSQAGTGLGSLGAMILWAIAGTGGSAMAMRWLRSDLRAAGAL